MEKLTLKELTKETIISLVKSLMKIINQSKKPIVWRDHLFEVQSIIRLYKYDYLNFNSYKYDYLNFNSFANFCETCELPKHKFYDFGKGNLTHSIEWNELIKSFSIKLNEDELVSILEFINKNLKPVFHPLEIRIQVMLTEDEMRIFNLMRIDNSMKFTVAYINYHFKDIKIESVLESLLAKKLINKFSDTFYQIDNNLKVS